MPYIHIHMYIDINSYYYEARKKKKNEKELFFFISIWINISKFKVKSFFHCFVYILLLCISNVNITNSICNMQHFCKCSNWISKNMKEKYIVLKLIQLILIVLHGSKTNLSKNNIARCKRFTPSLFCLFNLPNQDDKREWKRKHCHT